MFLLTDTTHSLSLTTTAAVSVDYVVSWADNTASAFTPGSSQGNTTTATTTTIVDAPAASTQRQVKSIVITNRHATDPNTVQVFKVVSADSYAISEAIVLSAGQSLLINDKGWTIMSDQDQVVVATGKLLTVNSALTLTGTDGTVMTFPSTSATLARKDVTETFADGVNVQNDLVAGAIKKSGGTSSQFLKADGSVDSTSYTTNVGTVTSVGGTGTVSGLTLTGSVSTSGNLTLGGTLVVAASNFAPQTAKTFLCAPNAADGTPTFRAILASDVPILNQDTTGSANSLKSIATTGLLSVTGPATGTTRTMTVPDADFSVARKDVTETFAGRVLIDDTTDATTTLDGSLQTDGGLSVAKNAVIGGGINEVTGYLEEVAENNKKNVLLKLNGANILHKQYQYWNGSAWAVDSGYFLGDLAGQYNSGNGTTGLGYVAAQYNSGAYSTAVGLACLGKNTGSQANALGYYSLAFNTGVSCIGLGHVAGIYNIGSYCNLLGYASGQYNQGSFTNVIGWNSNANFKDNAGAAKTFAYAAVDTTNDTITIPAHGFGTVGTWVNLRYNAGVATSITGLSTNGVYQFYIVDANTVALKLGSRVTGDMTAVVGTGSDLKLTPQYVYSGCTIIGNGLEPDASNQIIIGTGNNTPRITFNGTNWNIPGTTESTSTTTGAFTVAGGAGIGGTLYAARLATTSTRTLTSGTYYQSSSVLFLNPGADSASTFSSVNGYSEVSSGCIYNLSSVRGGTFYVEHRGSGTVTNFEGCVISSLSKTTSGTVSNLIGSYIQFGNYVSGGTVVNAYGQYIASPYVAGTITNAYGLRIENITGATTNNYSIKTGTGLVDFGDNVNVASGKVYKVNGTQVLTARQAAIADSSAPDATDLATAITLVNELKTKLNTALAMLRTHGLIAS